MASAADSTVGESPYIIDDYTALLAATELYATTGKSEYLLDADKRAESLSGRLSKDGYFWSDDDKTRPFWHASDAGLPLIALIRYAEVGLLFCTGGRCNSLDVGDTIKKHYDWLLSITDKVENPFGYARQAYKTGGEIKEGFFIPHDNESGYWWQGEDARIASLAAAVAYATHSMHKIEGHDGGDKYAANQLDWILGKNPYGVSMMYGIGKKNPAKYDGTSDYDATLEGGIANGITGKNKEDLVDDFADGTLEADNYCINQVPYAALDGYPMLFMPLGCFISTPEINNPLAIMRNIWRKCNGMPYCNASVGDTMITLGKDHFVCEEGSWVTLEMLGKEKNGVICTNNGDRVVVRGNDNNDMTYICLDSFWRAISNTASLPAEYFLNPDFEYGTFEDPRDGHVYKTTVYEGKTWLAQDIDYYDKDDPLFVNQSKCAKVAEHKKHDPSENAYCDGASRFYRTKAPVPCRRSAPAKGPY